MTFFSYETIESKNTNCNTTISLCKPLPFYPLMNVCDIGLPVVCVAYGIRDLQLNAGSEQLASEHWYGRW